MSKLPDLGDTRVAIVGLGYVGLPLAVEFGKHFPTIGFDINASRIEELCGGHDATLEVTAELLRDEAIRPAGNAHRTRLGVAAILPVESVDGRL